MKIAITGHTSGIGKSIADLYGSENVLGFSRSNGYDINSEEIIDKIIAESSSCDTFINNAFHSTSQSILLDRFFDTWKEDSSKTIVNIISRSRYGFGKAESYAKSKTELYLLACEKMFTPGRQCRIININPGYVNTNAVDHLRGNVKMMTPEHLAQMIKWCIDQPQGIEIGEFSVWRR